MERIFGSWQTAVLATIGAAWAVVVLALDLAGVWPGVPWQVLAIVGFLGFAAIVVWRIKSLTASPLHVEVRWDRQQPTLVPFSWTMSDDGHALFNATLTGRVWATENLTLDEVFVLFRKRRRGALRFLRQDICKGTLSDAYFKFKGPIHGRVLQAGEQIPFDRSLFCFKGYLAPRDRPRTQVEAKLVVQLRAPHVTLKPNISAELQGGEATTP